MKIKTITCHDVYNAGASLQAYALTAYLRQLGHDVEIINYKPDYLSNHYALWNIGNPRYDKPLLREAYLLAKLPQRLKARTSRRKKEFDLFTANMLPVTEKRYSSNAELKADPPEADVYFAGSDQIWNPFFQNGRDPAFYLDFVPDGKVSASYAASFATDSVPPQWQGQLKQWLSELDFISVRESSGLNIVRDMGISDAVQVLDPVFLLDAAQWQSVETDLDIHEPYLLVYDFDRSPEIAGFVKRAAVKHGWKIYSILPCEYCDRCFSEEGPQAFLYLIRNASFVVSNSFHATAFSLIFHKQFAVFNRREEINTRMRDLVCLAGVEERLIAGDDGQICDMDYGLINKKLEEAITQSKAFIQNVLGSVK